MFTGIIQHIGVITSITKNGPVIRYEIAAPTVVVKKSPGASMAIDGACFTLIKKTSNTFFVEAMPETIKKTIIKNYKKGTKVNLETPLTLGSPLDGHLVSGHVDGRTTIKAVQHDKKIKILEIDLPKDLRKFCAIKGSVTINGISLTISKKNKATIEVSLIPYTLQHTTMNQIKAGDEVNIEVDLLSRYLAALQENTIKK